VPADDSCGDQGYVADSIDRAIIQQTQHGLALVHNPWQQIAASIGSNSEDVLTRIARMKHSGIIRRIGAVPNHYRLGLTANGMTVWDVSDKAAMRLGELIGQLDFVSHCYLRPRHWPVWRYNLFAMVHGHEPEEVERKTEIIADGLGEHCRAHEILFSSAILKKTGLRLVA
jgi:DNA-binding Lrp family transcriptional regulator